MTGQLTALTSIGTAEPVHPGLSDRYRHYSGGAS